MQTVITNNEDFVQTEKHPRYFVALLIVSPFRGSTLHKFSLPFKHVSTKSALGYSSARQLIGGEYMWS